MILKPLLINLMICMISYCNRTGTHNHLVCRRTLNHFTKLAKWLSCVVSTYLYGAFDCIFLSCYVRISDWIHTLYLPECQGSPCSKQARCLKIKWLQRDSNPQPLSSLTTTQPCVYFTNVCLTSCLCILWILQSLTLDQVGDWTRDSKVQTPSIYRRLGENISKIFVRILFLWQKNMRGRSRIY